MNDAQSYQNRPDRLDYYADRQSPESDLTPEQLDSIDLRGPVGEVAGLAVYTVDGDKLRLIDQDFVEDANGGRYGYTPDGQLWIELNVLVNLGDAAAILLHGAVEHLEMRDAGASYEQAHAAANDHERALRQALESGEQAQPSSLEEAIAAADDWARKSGHFVPEGVNSTLPREPEEKDSDESIGTWAERLLDG